jgi:malate dehydrogenase (oxaloacetate-decarboxylating)(NADP+)
VAYPITDWDKYEELLGRLGNDNKMVRLITNRARTKTYCFAEADHLDVLKAAQIAYEEGICHLFYWEAKKSF